MISRPEILGAWALVSYELRALDGTHIEYPFGDDAQGFLIYTDDGYMSAQLMRRHRPLYDRPSGAGGTTEQSAATRGRWRSSLPSPRPPSLPKESSLPRTRERGCLEGPTLYPSRRSCREDGAVCLVVA